MGYTVKFKENEEKQGTYYYERGKGGVNVESLEVVEELYVTYNLTKFFSKASKFNPKELRGKTGNEMQKRLMKVVGRLKELAENETVEQRKKMNPTVKHSFASKSTCNFGTQRESSFTNAFNVAKKMLHMAMSNPEKTFEVR